MKVEIIILVILLSGIVGFKRGFTREIVSAVGFFLVVVLSYYLKNPITVFFYEKFFPDYLYFPFFHDYLHLVPRITLYAFYPFDIHRPISEYRYPVFGKSVVIAEYAQRVA